MTTTRTARAAARPLIVALLLSLCLVGCASPGNTSHVVLEVGPSQLFTEPEIRAAMAAVMEKFKDIEGCDLLRLRYDESFSELGAEVFLEYGGRHDPPVTAENVMVLMSEFYAGPHADSSLNRNTTYSWSWGLTRSGPGSNWVVVDWGYG